ncbi:MAG: alpha/beta fold hydrolase [Pseudomonadota bacterium]
MTRSALDATSAFYQAMPGVRLFRFILTATQRMWPRLAVHAASRLFLTPLPTKYLHRGRKWDATWNIEAWPFEAASLTLYSQVAKVSGTNAPLALLVHGWGGHAGQMLALADALHAQGFHPVILEMPAHGRSAGMSSNLPQFTRAIEYVSARLRQDGHTVHALIAHSLGASASAYVASRGAAIGRLVLLAPPASPPEYTHLFAHVFGLSERTRAAMQHRIEAQEALLMPQLEAHAVGPHIRVPTLVIHDRHDSINRFDDGKAYVQAIAGATMLATEGLGHRKLLKDAAVMAAVVGFVAWEVI